jgi:catechol 2,3-dioxygenase-like lactoylglutathione lyase family enzyme
MKTTPIKVRKLGHFVYEVSDIERSTEFWTDIMGFSVSDRNELGMVFLRTASDHHAVALIPSKKATRPPADAGLAFNHLALEVDDIEVAQRGLHQRAVRSECSWDGLSVRADELPLGCVSITR